MYLYFYESTLGPTDEELLSRTVCRIGKKMTIKQIRPLHPTKEELREKIAYFIAEEMDFCKAKEIEAEMKCKLDYNYR